MSDTLRDALLAVAMARHASHLPLWKDCEDALCKRARAALATPEPAASEAERPETPYPEQSDLITAYDKLLVERDLLKQQLAEKDAEADELIKQALAAQAAYESEICDLADRQMLWNKRLRPKKPTVASVRAAKGQSK